MKLLNIDSNYKTVKGQAKGYMTAILYLSPANTSGHQVCPFASPGCIDTCLNTAGRGQFNSIQEARKRKTEYFFKDRVGFISQLKHEIKNFEKYAHKKGFIPVVRLNGTSDLTIETYGVIETFPEIQFYDYTKNYQRMVKFLDGGLPENYHLTFSRSETNEIQSLDILKRHGNVAVLFESMPKEWHGYDVVSGDDSDLRFLDKAGTIIGLKPKGKARKDISGFVVRTI